MRYNVEHKQADILSDHERIQFQGGYNIMKKKLAVLLTAALAAASDGKRLQKTKNRKESDT